MGMLKGEDFLWELAHKENLHPSTSGTIVPPIALELFYLLHGGFIAPALI